MSFEVIIPFLKPIEHLLMDTTISEIMVNPDGSVWIEEKGHIVSRPNIRFDDGALLTGLEVIAYRAGKKLDADSPILNLRLPDGSRLAAIIPPVVNPAPKMTIRNFRTWRLACAVESRRGGLSFRGKPVDSFEIAGADHYFEPAEAHIDGEAVVVSSPSVPSPQFARYAWNNAVQGLLYNSAGLPASTFTSEAEPTP